MITRRKFVAAAAWLLGAPHGVHAQGDDRPRQIRVGVLYPGANNDVFCKVQTTQ